MARVISRVTAGCVIGEPTTLSALTNVHCSGQPVFVHCNGTGEGAGSLPSRLMTTSPVVVMSGHPSVAAIERRGSHRYIHLFNCP